MSPAKCRYCCPTSNIFVFFFPPACIERLDTADEDRIDPVDTDEYMWIAIKNPAAERALTDGKWLVFRDFDEINEPWLNVIHALKRGELQGCLHAKCSTKMYRPTKSGPGPCTTAVIYIYTSQEDYIKVGLELCTIVKQDVHYKTEAATEAGKYDFKGNLKTTDIKTIYYNNGEPKIDSNVPCPGQCYNREDEWHLNIVEHPEYAKLKHTRFHGKWEVPFKIEDLDMEWHSMKEKIGKREINVLKMVCPANRLKKDIPIFHFYTSKENWRGVGDYLIDKYKRDIKYIPEVIFSWNEGKPSLDFDL